MASPGGSPGRDASSRSGIVLPLASQSPLAPSPGGLGAPGVAETTALARRAQEAFSALQLAHDAAQRQLSAQEAAASRSEEAAGALAREVREVNARREEDEVQHKHAMDKAKADVASARRDTGRMREEVGSLKGEVEALKRQLALSKEECERQRHLAARAQASAEDARTRCQRADAETERQHAYASGLRRDMDALVASVSKASVRSAPRTPASPFQTMPTPTRLQLPPANLPTALESPAPSVPALNGLASQMDPTAAAVMENAALRTEVRRLEGELANAMSSANSSHANARRVAELQGETAQLRAENESLRVAMRSPSAAAGEAAGRIAALEGENARLRANGNTASQRIVDRIAALEAENVQLHSQVFARQTNDSRDAVVDANVQVARLEAQLEETRRQLIVSEEAATRAASSRDEAHRELARARAEEESWMRKAVSARADSASTASSPLPSATATMLRDIQQLRDENRRLSDALAKSGVDWSAPTPVTPKHRTNRDTASEVEQLRQDLLDAAAALEKLRAEKCELEQRLYAGEEPPQLPSTPALNDAQEFGRAVASAVRNFSSSAEMHSMAPANAQEVEAYTAEIAVLRRQVAEMQEMLITNESRRRDEMKLREEETAERIRSAEAAAEQRAIDAHEQSAKHAQETLVLRRELEESQGRYQTLMNRFRQQEGMLEELRRRLDDADGLSVKLRDTVAALEAAKSNGVLANQESVRAEEERVAAIKSAEARVRQVEEHNAKELATVQHQATLGAESAVQAREQAAELGQKLAQAEARRLAAEDARAAAEELQKASEAKVSRLEDDVLALREALTERDRAADAVANKLRVVFEASERQAEALEMRTHEVASARSEARHMEMSVRKLKDAIAAAAVERQNFMAASSTMSTRTDDIELEALQQLDQLRNEPPPLSPAAPTPMSTPSAMQLPSTLPPPPPLQSVLRSSEPPASQSVPRPESMRRNRTRSVVTAETESELMRLQYDTFVDHMEGAQRAFEESGSYYSKPSYLPPPQTEARLPATGISEDALQAQVAQFAEGLASLKGEIASLIGSQDDSSAPPTPASTQKAMLAHVPPPPPPPLSPPTGSAWRSKLVPRESEEYRPMIDSNGAPDRKLRSARDFLERAGRVDRSISIHMKTPPDVRPPTSSPYAYHPPPSIPTYMNTSPSTMASPMGGA